MKKITKLGIVGAFLAFAAVVTTSCTSNFCKNIEKSRILFAIEPGVSEYYESKDAADAAKKNKNDVVEQVYTTNDHLWRLVRIEDNGNYSKSNQLSNINSNCKGRYYTLPSTKYLTSFDTKLLSMAITKYNEPQAESQKVSEATITAEQTNNILTEYGYLKFYGADDQLWKNYEYINGLVSAEIGSELCPSTDYVKTYQSSMNSSISTAKSCIAITEGKYGNFGQDKTAVTIDKKDWGYAWSKGPISGLIVFPVAWLVDSITAGIAGGISVQQLSGGWPQLLALVIVTIIVRLFIFGATFKSTLSQQKMQALQPELAKIQAKYPNSNKSQAEKQRLSEEQMKLYKKNKVNPLGQILVLVIQFPIFIGVWGAMTGCAVLSTGAFLNLNLSTSILDALKMTTGLPSNTNGWWTALVLFILMSVAQFLSMKIPQWITKRRTKKVARLGVNPAQKSSNRTMNIISYAMLIMIIFMGLTLPSAMGVYWLVGALFSLAQSLITQAIVARKKVR